MIATALFLAGAIAGAVPAGDAAPTQRSGYPKLYRCASPVARPDAQPGWSSACLAWRAGEMRRLEAMPPAVRAVEVAGLRERMGLSPAEGLSVNPAGRLMRVLR